MFEFSRQEFSNICHRGRRMMSCQSSNFRWKLASRIGVLGAKANLDFLTDQGLMKQAMSIWQFSSSQTLSPSTYLMFCAGFTVVINHSYVWRRRMVKFLYEIKRAWNQGSDCSILTPFSPKRISVLRAAVFYILLHLAEFTFNFFFWLFYRVNSKPTNQHSSFGGNWEFGGFFISDF